MKRFHRNVWTAFNSLMYIELSPGNLRKEGTGNAQASERRQEMNDRATGCAIAIVGSAILWFIIIKMILWLI